MSKSNTPYLLEMESISKSFPGVQALKDVTFTLQEGEVVGLVGENGAGKTTLMNILAGVVSQDEGEVSLNGNRMEPENPSDARNQGIAYIHQELNLIEELSVKENMFLGAQLRKNWGTLDHSAMEREVNSVLETLDVDVNPKNKVKDLSVALRQMLEIARALLFDARVIIMDEPTSSLTEEEIETLFELVGELRSQDRGVIYISHRIEEIFEVTDRVTVLRNGELVGTKRTSDTDRDEIIKMMAGKEVEQRYYKEQTEVGEPILEVNDLVQNDDVQGVSFELKSGEIFGIAGLMGSGRTELVETLFGITPPDEGSIKLKGEQYYPSSPNDAINQGVAYLPEDREMKGLFLDFDVTGNINITKIEKGGVIIDKPEVEDPVEEVVERLGIVTPSLESELRGLSGGNRQKVIFARWMFAGMDLLLVNEPTRGIDVQTKVEIYNLLYDLNNQGVGIVMISSELPEILTVSDRIGVMHEGKLVKTFERDEADKEQLLDRMTGGSKVREGE